MESGKIHRPYDEGRRLRRRDSLRQPDIFQQVHGTDRVLPNRNIRNHDQVI